MNSPVALSTSTIITVGAFFLVIVALMLMRKALATILTALALAIVIVVVIQAATGQVLVNLSELGQFAMYYCLQLFYWVRDTFWPSLSNVVKDVSGSLQ